MPNPMKSTAKRPHDDVPSPGPASEAATSAPPSVATDAQPLAKRSRKSSSQAGAAARCGRTALSAGPAREAGGPSRSTAQLTAAGQARMLLDASGGFHLLRPRLIAAAPLWTPEQLRIVIDHSLRQDTSGPITTRMHAVGAVAAGLGSDAAPFVADMAQALADLPDHVLPPTLVEVDKEELQRSTRTHMFNSVLYECHALDPAILAPLKALVGDRGLVDAVAVMGAASLREQRHLAPGRDVLLTFHQAGQTRAAAEDPSMIARARVFAEFALAGMHRMEIRDLCLLGLRLRDVIADHPHPQAGPEAAELRAHLIETFGAELESRPESEAAVAQDFMNVRPPAHLAPDEARSWTRYFVRT